MIRASYALLVVTLSTGANGQWATGPTGHFSLDERARNAAYGVGGRITYTTARRWSYLGDLDIDVPQYTSWDRSFGARGALAFGIAPFTRQLGQNTRFQLDMKVGASCRIGRERQRASKAHGYWGALADVMHRTTRYQWETTDLITGSVRSDQGTTHGTWLVITPILGALSGEGRGRFFAEVSPLLRRQIDERVATWELRYVLSAGYLWSLGD
ncbi:MAG TPA: hypothetical protein PLV08_02800 [Flavobacteriales bacterium]|jgi:hypothetical protein|nr:hypothetical protein [Flavobacteriales bacterium]MBK7112626.1 hypothetical protein [Flavobacteriales bacterium]MBK7483418.1 hypothetical protein [Flavobacteriales bacterium]MBK7620465.1 hypothetical protein [Flavobacteriales bacterium]MBK8708348.1 hypothetical protein [Flavobacteriales bacterium]